MAHRLNRARRAGFLALAAVLASVVTAVPRAAADSVPTLEEGFTVSPWGNVVVGTTLTGTVGKWSGTGALSYELRWEMCDQYQRTLCETVASMTTDDPDDTSSYTPTGADNISDRFLYYSVTATDGAGTTRREQFVGPALPERRWYEPAESGIVATQSALGPDGAVTFVGKHGTSQWGTGLYAQRVTLGRPAGPAEPLYISDVFQPDRDYTELLSVEADDQGLVHVVFVDGRGNLMVTERDPASGEWASPTRLALSGTFQLRTFRDSDGENLLAAAGNGQAAVAWVVHADDDSPPEMAVATRGPSGWSSASVHVAGQAKWIDCGEAYSDVTFSDPGEAELGIDRSGDVTVIWTRGEQTCPGDPYQGYNRLEAVYRRDGVWTPVDTLNRMQGFYGNYVPVALGTSDAGAAVALTRSWFEGDSSNGRDDLMLLTASAGGTFRSLDPATNAPATVLRRWSDDGASGKPGYLDDIDIALADDGTFHVVWGAKYTGEGDRSALEVTGGTLATGAATPQTVFTRPGSLGSTYMQPRLAVADGGDASVVFVTKLLQQSPVANTSHYDADSATWAEPRTVHTVHPGAPRWFAGQDHAIRYDDAQRLHLVRTGQFAAVTRLAAGSAPPEVQLYDLQPAKVGRTETLAPVTDEDPDGGPLSYAWDLDDDGEYDDAETRQVNRTFTSPGRVWVGLRVTSPDGDFDVDRARVEVMANQPPSIGGIVPETSPVLAGEPASYIAWGSDDFDDPADLTYTWTFDDALDSTQTGDTAVHTFSTTGWHTITVTVTDTDGETTSRSANVLVEGEDPPATYTLDVTKIGPGSGRVDGQGVSCGTDCGGSYVAGTEVTLVADPADDSVFTGWTGCTEEVDGDCVVVMDDDVDVTAGFDVAASRERTLSVATTGVGVGAVTGPGIACGSDCTTVVQQGEQVVLTADPGASSKLKGWSGCDSVVDGGLGCSVTMGDDRTVSASFAPRFGAIDTVITATKVNHAKRKATISFSGSSPADVDRFECKLDAGSWTGCTSSTLLKKLTRGSHTFQVRTVDRDGITDKTPAEVTFKVKRR